jgi:hypothetical protein
VRRDALAGTELVSRPAALLDNDAICAHCAQPSDAICAPNVHADSALSNDRAGYSPSNDPDGFVLTNGRSANAYEHSSGCVPAGSCAGCAMSAACCSANCYGCGQIDCGFDGLSVGRGIPAAGHSVNDGCAILAADRCVSGYGYAQTYYDYYGWNAGCVTPAADRSANGCGYGRIDCGCGGSNDAARSGSGYCAANCVRYCDHAPANACRGEPVTGGLPGGVRPCFGGVSMSGNDAAELQVLRPAARPQLPLRRLPVRVSLPRPAPVRRLKTERRTTPQRTSS